MKPSLRTVDSAAFETRSAMGARRKSDEPPEILSGWKDIARHMGMAVRTVQRYESELGLPVRRPAGKPRAAVVATKSELNAWVAASPIRAVFQITKSPSDFPARHLVTVRRRLDEMRALRTQMWELRIELKNSLTLLTESIRCLQLGLLQNQPDSDVTTLAKGSTISRRGNGFSQNEFHQV